MKCNFKLSAVYAASLLFRINYIMNYIIDNCLIIYCHSAHLSKNTDERTMKMTGYWLKRHFVKAQIN